MNTIEIPKNEQRDIAVITTEIRTLTTQFRQVCVAFAVEIGRRLQEAKCLLPHGEWGTWLREQVDFSQRTADNYMRIFEEYGADQITLFGAVPNSQAIANLPITKALALLALPADERENFAEENNVEAMSTRELNDAIRAKLDAEKARDEAESLREDAEARVDALTEEAQTMKALIGDLNEEIRRLSEQPAGDPAQLEAATREAEVQRAAAADAQKRVDALAAELERAKEAAKKAKDKLKALKENPEIPAEAADKLRAEGAEAAEKKAAAALEDAKKTAEKLRAETAAAEERAAALEKQLATAAPELVVFKEAFGSVQAEIDRLQVAFENVQEKQPETAEKLKAAVSALAEKLKGW